MEELKFCDSEKRIVCVFGDISGFKSWIKRSGRDNLKTSFVDMALKWRRFQDADMFKTLGDGFMAVYEINKKNKRSRPLSILKASLECCRDINETIDESYSPRPYGFRIRISEGDGLKFQELRSDGSFCIDRKKPCKSFLSYDYISYYINMTKELLSVEEHIPVIVHENFKELLNGMARRAKINFKSLRKPAIQKTDIFDEDLEMLWIAYKRGSAYGPRNFRR